MSKNWKPLLALTLGGIFVAGITLSIATAQEEDDGRLVPIGPEGRALPELQGSPVGPPQFGQGLPFLIPGNPADIARMARPLSPYYIGVAVSPVSDVLRAHVNIPEGAGLVVDQVGEESPAAEGGVEQYDIIVSANGQDISSMDDLVAVVEENGGDNPSRFSLDIIRQGKSQTVWVTPTKRPEPAAGGFVPPAFPRGLGFNFNGVPGNLSIQTQEQNGEKKIIIERNGEKWEIVGDDSEAIKNLPEDLRPMVEQMLKDDVKMNFNFDALPNQPGVAPMPGMDEMQRRMQEQMRQMEEQLRRLEERIESPPQEDPRA